MPLLMCPNDNSAMQTLERSGVQFDMCPACRGVWLDRGELEKLMEDAASDARSSASSHTPPQAPTPWGLGSPQPKVHRSDDYRRDDRRRDDDDYRYKKKKRDSIFDIFD